MDKSDLHGQVEGVWRRLYFSGILITLTAPLAIVPWLKDMDIASPNNSLLQWIWLNAPDLGQNIKIFGSIVSSSLIVWCAVGLLVFGTFYFASQLKYLELLESYRDEAERRIYGATIKESLDERNKRTKLIVQICYERMNPKLFPTILAGYLISIFAFIANTLTPSFALSIFLISTLSLFHRLIVKYRIKTGFYGSDKDEAKEIICYLLEKSDDSTFHDKDGRRRRTMNPEQIESIKESILAGIPATEI